MLWVGHSLGGLVIKEALIQASQHMMHQRHEDWGLVWSTHTPLASCS